MDQLRALIFDLDGVIIDTEALHAEAKRLTFERYGIAVPERLYTEFRGRSDLDMVEHVVRELAGGALSPAEVVGTKHDVFRTLHEKIAPVEGALEFIRLARRRFERLALATSATRENQAFAFEKFDLRPFFDVVVTSEDIRRTKPHPDPYLKAAEKLGLSPGACLVIEDSTNGILSARAAGCAVAAITTSFSRDELRDARADMMVDSFPELASLLAIDAGGAA
ncbi:HAD family hydrolase [Sorangium sp. So ce176]|uniref:HAD family hydrolase n=1 Tax=Sorangium sp. So ce176 TaxID=3133286 RepID=UPI003F630B71